MWPHNQILLIIDDDQTLLMVLAKAMERRGFTLFCAQDGQAALQLCAQHQPSYISLDLKLAQESGLNLISQLKLSNEAARIVMLTAYASIATAVDAIKLGAYQYLCKPSDADQLLQAFSNGQTSKQTDTIQIQPTSVKRLEWEHIQQVMLNNQGNVSASARELGMHRRTLQRKLQKHPVKQ